MSDGNRRRDHVCAVRLARRVNMQAAFQTCIFEEFPG
nr:MAG TPA: hypothetical protein [Caudoviricetes sp.]